MITILNYHMGNLFSVEKKLRQLGAEVSIVSNPKELQHAKKIILPGVGHFGKAMDELKKLDLIGPLHEIVLEKQVPVLGICLGMQLMTKGSEEGQAEGLGWFNCRTERLQINDPLKFKIPHTGWNSIEHKEDDRIYSGLPSGSEVYFVHAFGVLHADSSDILSTTVYQNPFISSLKKNRIYGMQFHPEKSLENGEKIFRNFIEL